MKRQGGPGSENRGVETRREFKRNEWWAETREKGIQDVQTETPVRQGWVQLQTGLGASSWNATFQMEMTIGMSGSERGRGRGTEGKRCQNILNNFFFIVFSVCGNTFA